jgi:hypothetical protein
MFHHRLPYKSELFFAAHGFRFSIFAISLKISGQAIRDFKSETSNLKIPDFRVRLARGVFEVSGSE